MSEAAKAQPLEEGAAIAEVLVPVAIDHSYSYLVPSDIHVAAGDFVEVPLGTRMANGVVWETRPGTAARSNLKSIAAHLALPPLPANARNFIDWVARWTLSPRGMVLRMAIGAPLQAGPEPVRIGVRLAGPAAKPHDQSPRPRPCGGGRRACLPQGGARRDRRLFRHGVIDTLIDEGALEAIALPPEPAAQLCDPAFARPLPRSRAARRRVQS